ncbi:hypothetical protein BDBG_17147 [Blastomyces gilchristii SLH14081]|uniref:Uncharacterized protein n=1 Tax=Blastomyces gilchristii (strain SLH14081) TaxID=559298 RepID=A0A179UM26_BLAGS|nr:uncharacterized protein BDBG_17147 [Blastomyces gilchristii SLH14081]OAT09024.1 hypothetical protein BDBG_17147 [Blastomyces gilchristii SLH14081]
MHSLKGFVFVKIPAPARPNFHSISLGTDRCVSPTVRAGSLSFELRRDNPQTAPSTDSIEVRDCTGWHLNRACGS